MSETSHENVEAVFLQAIGLPADARGEYIRRQCGRDTELAEAVERLLVAHERAGRVGFLRRVDEKYIEPLEPDRRLGNFRLVRLIAHGGMSTVYEAVQEPIERTVALKVLRAALVSHTTRRRFEDEWHTLGQLSHPGIVQIHEAGMEDTPAGQVAYFAMELVQGARTLTEYAEDRQATISGRLTLMQRVCEIVAYAHERGVIHRDLKPANILVDADGGVKVVDFGIARTTNADIQATRTESGDLVGTITYMSPEQCRGQVERLDERTDVYSLGVILYELLCGRPPYALADRPLHEVLRIVQEEPPPAPGGVSGRLGGQLEVIVLKALEKEPVHRYASVRELGDDVRRYLEGRPVLGRSPSLGRRIAKFVQRRRTALGFGLAAAVVLALATLLVIPPGPPRAYVSVAAVDAAGRTIRGAAVYVRPVDRETRELGAPLHLGETALRKAAVAPGNVRLVVVGDAGFAEIPAAVATDGEYDFTVPLADTEAVTSDMIYVPGGPAIVGGATTPPPFHERTVDVPAFWIDRHEVSNGEYKAFVDATGHRMPVLWGGEYREVWADLPIVGVTWHDACAYAAWRGKRLPTDIEWERAARGPSGWLYPWGDDRGDVRRKANAGRGEYFKIARVTDDPALRATYERSVIPVNTLPAGMVDRTKEGALHMFGNVAELTSSPGGIPGNGDSRLWKGDAWGRAPEDPHDLPAYGGIPAEAALLSIGFRCAKSADPLAD